MKSKRKNLELSLLLYLLSALIITSCVNKDGAIQESSSQVPVINHPVDGSAQYQTIPYFDWDDVVKEQPYPGKYIIQIAEDKRFKSLIDVDTVPALISHYSTNFELEYGKNYYWKVAYMNNDERKVWSKTQSFNVQKAPAVVTIDTTDGWAEITAKFNQVKQNAEKSAKYIELRFPENHTFHITQIKDNTLVKEDQDYLFYMKDVSNVIINGNGSKLILEVHPELRHCGVFYARGCSNIQIKDFTIDYAKNSLAQFGGVVSNLDMHAIAFDVTVDTTVYKNFEEIKRAEASGNIEGSYFLSEEHHQRVGFNGEHFPMKENWTQAQIAPNKFHFTKPDDLMGWNKVKDELKNGDIYITSFRAGDIINLIDDNENVVVNNITSLAARSRCYCPNSDCSFARAIGLSFLKTQGRYLGASSGGVNDKTDNLWMEDCRFEYIRDDSYHGGIRGGSQVAFRNNTIVGGFRHSIWVNSDRVWVSGNLVENAGLEGIQLGWTSSSNEAGDGFHVNGAIIENNTIINPRHYGIETSFRKEFPNDPETGKYSEHIIIRNNTVIDNQMSPAFRLDYLKNSVVENNKVINKNNADFRVYSQKAEEAGFYFSNSVNVTGSGNVVNDTRLSNGKDVVIGENNKNISILK